MLHTEHSSDEDTQQIGYNNTSKDTPSESISFPLSQKQSIVSQQTIDSNSKPKNGDEAITQSSNDVDQSDSFIRDTMLEQQNIDEKKQAKRGNFLQMHRKADMSNWL